MPFKATDRVLEEKGYSYEIFNSTVTEVNSSTYFLQSPVHLFEWPRFFTLRTSEKIYYHPSFFSLFQVFPEIFRKFPINLSAFLSCETFIAISRNIMLLH